MLFYYSTLLAGFFLIAYVIRLKRDVFYSLAKNSVGLVNVLIAKTDEDEKIKLIQNKTNRLVLSFAGMLLLVGLAFAVGAIPIAVYVLLTKSNWSNLDFSSIYSIISISVGATLPFIIPFNKKSKSDYSELSQLLHHLALDNYHISNKLFKREVKKYNKKYPEKRKDFVIISGLARAGTTSLMNDLSRIDGFISVNCGNMPFLMCPNTWRKIYKPKNKNIKERSHKDGIMIGYNSNEALEEYFFKVKAGDSYIKESCLEEYDITEDDYSEYLDYQSIIKKDRNKIYLAKNNNFILRYNSVRNYNNEFIMVILFRDPVTHAASLKEKHEYYCKLQKTDPFVLDYMNWLGHHEFGLNQKPFVFKNTPLEIQEDKSTIDYWLKIWINYYEHALTADHPNTIFINYDSYCKEPGNTVNRILEKTCIENNPVENKPFINKRKNIDEISENLNKTAQELYLKLKTKSGVSRNSLINF
jgi:hypothetical protein